MIIGRFFPVVRTFAPIMAGATEINFMKFNIYNILGAVIWVWSLIPMGFLLGRQFPALINQVEYLFLIITGIVSTSLIIGYIKQRKKMETENKQQVNNSIIN